MIHCFHLFWSTFSSLTGLVDKYSEKPKKLLVLELFQSIHLLVKMTNALSVGFAFSLSLRYNRNKVYTEEELNSFSRETLMAVILSMQDQPGIPVE